MQIYLDSSALVKRALREDESDALIEPIDEWVREGSQLVSSTLGRGVGLPHCHAGS